MPVNSARISVIDKVSLEALSAELLLGNFAERIDNHHPANT
jgi:hypothetical protein